MRGKKEQQQQKSTRALYFCYILFLSLIIDVIMRGKRSPIFILPNKPVSCISFPSCLSHSSEVWDSGAGSSTCGFWGPCGFCLLQWRDEEAPEVMVVMIAASRMHTVYQMLHCMYYRHFLNPTFVKTLGGRCCHS